MSQPNDPLAAARGQMRALQSQLDEVRSALSERDGAGKLCVALQERVALQDTIIAEMTNAGDVCRSRLGDMAAAFAVLESRIPRERRASDAG